MASAVVGSTQFISGDARENLYFRSRRELGHVTHGLAPVAGREAVKMKAPRCEFRPQRLSQAAQLLAGLTAQAF